MIILNGRGPSGRSGAHLYVAAESKADAARMLIKLFGGTVGTWAREIRIYWSVGSWGLRMDGITPARGVWVTDGHTDKPRRLYPRRVKR
jgi:hypothetical protein